MMLVLPAPAEAVYSPFHPPRLKLRLGSATAADDTKRSYEVVRSGRSMMMVRSSPW